MEYSSEIYEALFVQLKEGREETLQLDRVASQRVKATKAGEMLYIKSFPVWKTAADGGRATRVKPSSETVRKLNQRHAREANEILINANFGKDDYVLTLTYTENPTQGMRLGDAYYADEPQDEVEAQENMRKYIKALRRMVARLGGDPKLLRWLYVTEATYSKHPDADGRARFHHHVLIGGDVGNGVRLTRDEIEDLWQAMPFSGHGRTKCEWIQPGSAGLAGLAAYMTKTEDGIKTYIDAQGEKRGRHLCHHSRNLKRPAPTVADRKLSKRRVARVAQDVMANGAEIFETIYPGYVCAETPRVYVSDYVAGAYIYAKLRKREETSSGAARHIPRGAGKALREEVRRSD